MTERIPVRRDLTHTILSVLLIGLLIASTLYVLRPFLIPLIWATIIAVSTWPILQRLQKRLANKRFLAVLVMTAALILVVLTPLTLAVLTIGNNARNITAQVKSFDPFSLAWPPVWLSRVPLEGKKLADRWKALAALNPAERSARVSPYAEKALRWFVAQAGTTARTSVNFLLTMVIVIILYAKGETVREWLLRFARRLAGQQGEDAAILAGKAMRGVSLGVVVTALVQAAIGGIGVFLAGVPASGLLTAVMFILCLAQLGPGLVLFPSVIWLYTSGHAFWGTVLLVFSVVACTIDNVLRPVLIKKGVDLPLLLIFAGVIGGLVAFGVIGLFIGPVILAVSHTLLKVWMADDPHLEAAIAAGELDGTSKQ
ncbi:MAG TPA: AI-2E family transporter YdiK [Terriglobia bacterium]|nr:AI-2E family transporter YdiK [Terriglobia bacterium]